MRIQTVRSSTLRIPLEHPVTVGGGLKITEREYLLVAVETDTGLTGVGWSFTRGGDLAGAVRCNLAPLLVGADPLATERLWESVYRGTRYIGRGGLVMRAISAVDIALWDLKGQAAGLPLHRLLGGYREQVPVLMAGMYYTPGRTPDEDAREAAGYLEEGYRMLKLMGGVASFAVDLARVKAVRQAVGPEIKLALDVNGAWREPKAAAQYARALAEYGVAFIEEPCLTEELNTLKALVAASPIPIATGEVETGRWAFRDLVDGGADILRPDATVVGGISEWLKVHALAVTWALPVIPHDFPYVHVHLAAALAGVEAVEFVTSAGGISNFHYIVRNQLRPSGGQVAAPEGPGLGIVWDWAAIERYAVK